MNKTQILLSSWSILSTLITPVNAENNSLIYEFVGSPLIVLAAVIVIDIAAYLIKKIRR